MLAPVSSQDLEPQTRLFSFLDSLGLSYSTVWHKPVFTVDEGKDIEDSIPGLHCKNLFLKDHKGSLWLVVLPGAVRADLKKLEKQLGSGRLSFGKPALLEEVLGVTPGTVTPFALMNDVAHLVQPVLDSVMMQAPLVTYHPLRNDASTTLTPADLLKFIHAVGFDPLQVEC